MRNELCGFTRAAGLVAALLMVAGAWASAQTWSRLPEDNAAVAPAALPVEVLPDNANLRYTGRFDRTNPKEALCAWPATAVTMHFRGTAVNVRLGTGANRFEVAVDNAPVKTLSTAGADPHSPPVAPAPLLYSVAAGLPPGEHRVTIFKCTEPKLGNAAFAGFQLNAGATVLPAAPARRRIKVIGDSISCGYGNEAADKSEHFSPGTENAWWTYGAIAARALDADYECIAWSGRKLYPNFTIPEVYDRTLPGDVASRWPGEQEKPDAILVNLCTNDFNAKDAPDRAGWVKAYHDFLARLRRDAPRAAIYCALGPMITDGYPQGRPSLSTAREWIQQVVKETNDAGDAGVRFLEFPRQQPVNGIGADYHPSVRTQQLMAGQFAAALRADLKW